ncbi:hypothetical protein LY625_03925 [Lysobacter sp. GX 14042]|uniref:hypothetical protein n=1 Tax=Lysobacter sp. GX 14042 TaxID=2907155 RepID=UPI001F41D1EF|nr:hypothetical protein [Lysobacter sp. GX 14042]MCE7031771.1 hypothetical protein [Lysobacter sp. GX 14042]
MSSEKYAGVDAGIVLDLHDRPRSGYYDWEIAKTEAKKLAPNGWDRVLDRRLQALRRRGLVAFVNREWVRKEATNEQ